MITSKAAVRKMEYTAMAIACVFFVWQGVHINAARKQNAYGAGDLRVYTAAGQVVAEKTTLLAPDIYNPKKFRPAVQSIRKTNGGTHFFYPPQAAVLFAPLAWVPWHILVTLWTWANTLMLLGVVYGVIYFGLRDRVQRIGYSILVLLLAFANPVQGIIRTGQINAWIWMLMIGGCIALAHKKQSATGIAFAVATAIKIFPVLFLPYLILKKQWRAVGAFCATSFVLWAATIPSFGFRGLQRFWHYPFTLLLSGRINSISKSMSLYGGFRNLLHNHALAWLHVSKKILIADAGIVFQLLTVATLVVIGLALWKKRTSLSRVILIEDYTIMLCFFLLFSKFVHMQYMLWILPMPLLLLSQKSRLIQLFGGCVIAGALFSTALPLNGLLFHRTSTLTVLVLFIAVLLVRFRKHDPLV